MRKKLTLMAASIITFVAFMLPLHPVRTLEAGIPKPKTPKPTPVVVLASYKRFDTVNKVPVTIQDWAYEIVGADNFPYVDYIFTHESGWSLTDVNSIGCYGIGQNCGTWLAESCPNWQNDAPCQIRRFDQYARERYGGWYNAYVFWQNNRWW